MPQRFLITGATGNVGKAVLKHLDALTHDHTVVAGLRDLEKEREALAQYPDLELVHFDFEKPETYAEALAEVDCVFLLRPPQIADVDGVFAPLIDAMQQAGAKRVVFLSVQGVERSSVIPHHKIEKLIEKTDLAYIFLRPSYFMQNLTTTLAKDLKEHREILLPAGSARFLWVDVDNIGEVGAHMMLQFDQYVGQKPEITGQELFNFYEVAAQINQVVDNPIRYRAVGPLRFWWIKRQRGQGQAMILVMIMLHFLPRFQKDPAVSDFYEKLTGKKPTSLHSFIEREQAALA